MTIQNIDDVMDRIMSLNRNLTEESLKTLLSASGWDKDDITEGVHIFRSTNSSSLGAPLPLEKKEPKEEDISIKKEKEINYDLGSLKKEAVPLPPLEDKVLEETKPEIKTEIIEDIKPEIKAPSDIQKDVTEKENLILNTPVENEYNFKIVRSSDNNLDNSELKKTEPEINQKVIEEIKETSKEEIVKNVENKSLDISPKKKIGFGKILSLILLSLILLFLILYLYNPNFNFNKIFSYFKQTTTSSIPVNVTNYNENSQKQIDALKQEINNLKEMISKNQENVSTSTVTKTIVKYISQRGATGKTGRGISSVTASTSGLIVNYTDKTSSFVPYADKTDFNTINANYVCLNDLSTSTDIFVMATTSTSTANSNICIDKDTFLNLVK